MVIVRDGVSGDVTPADIANGKAGEELTDLHEFALMSAAVYADDDVKRSACKSDLDTPSDLFPWKRAADFRKREPEEAPPGHVKVGDAEYDLWELRAPNAAPKVALAFRGSDKEAGDWFANLRWVTSFIWFTWDQYDQVLAHIGPLVERIKRAYGDNVQIITTGHSLGGGLAQQAAYASDDIELVYAFDPSLVTGYYGVQPPETRVRNSQGITIYRAYEHGEILAYLRWLMKRVYPVSEGDPKIIEVRYDLLTGGIAGQHSMADFACQLRQIAAGRKPSPDDSPALAYGERRQ